MTLRQFYLAAAVVGTIVPWWFFGSFFSTSGFSIPIFVQALFDNGAAGGFAADVLISLVIFLVWSWHDACRHSVAHWWLVLPASFGVGLSLAMPLYFYLRTRTVRS